MSDPVDEGPGLLTSRVFWLLLLLCLAKWAALAWVLGGAA